MQNLKPSTSRPRQTRHTISSLTIGFSFDDFSHVVDIAMERVWIKKPAGEKNNSKSESRELLITASRHLPHFSLTSLS